jgi:hypothetical protein
MVALIKNIPWSTKETEVLLNSLKRNETYSQMKDEFPLRTKGAVLHKANTLSYGHDTLDDEIYFRPYIKHKHRRTKTKIKGALNE